MGVGGNVAGKEFQLRCDNLLKRFHHEGLGTSGTSKLIRRWTNNKAKYLECLIHEIAFTFVSINSVESQFNSANKC